MKTYFWCAFALGFQIGALTGEINDSANHKMFSFHNGGIQISCQYPETVQQLKMQLCKGAEVLCDLTKTKEDGNVVSIENQKFCPYQLSNNSVSFYLNNLDSSQGSYYSCHLSIFDPPPFQEKVLSREYLHIYESQLCCQLKLWLPIGCAAFVVVYIFGCIFIFWFAKKKYGSSVHDPNSEYMFMAAVNTAKKSKFADCSGSHESGVALQTVLESQGCEKSSSLGQTAPLDSRMCEEAQKSQDRVASPRKYAAWKSALAL